MRAAGPSRVLVASLSALAGAALGVLGVALLKPHGGEVFASASQHVFTRSRLVEGAGPRTRVRELTVKSHGGITRVEWANGAVSPVAPRSQLYVALYIDGGRAASTLLDASHQRHESRPAGLVWVGRLTPGSHHLVIKGDSRNGAFLVPEASRGAPVADTLVVREYEE
jgi:hypothetical protein